MMVPSSSSTSSVLSGRSCLSVGAASHCPRRRPSRCRHQSVPYHPLRPPGHSFAFNSPLYSDIEVSCDPPRPIPLPRSLLARPQPWFGRVAGLSRPGDARDGEEEVADEQAQQREPGGRDGAGSSEEVSAGLETAGKKIVLPTKDVVTIAACVVGLLTGVGVVLFNNAVHEIRDFFWDGIPSRGASWLREEPLEEVWPKVILVPACGGVLVSMLNSLRSSMETPSFGLVSSNVKGVLRPFLKAIAASVTLGTGNSLGPEGPSVEIGSSIAKGVGRVFQWSGAKKSSLVAAGSAAGISSGFNAAVTGCFFAVESVLWPSPADSFSPLTNSTPMVILSSVIASVVSEVGLGSDPAFTVPEYDFRSPSELPLYLLLGILCGLVSITLSGCTSFALEMVENFHKSTKISKAMSPVLGGLTVGLIALAYPEILYWGFENVDILLESRPFVNGLSAEILLQLVGVKIIATSLSRASGLVGGYYAPSLFIGAATGMAYGKLLRSTLGGPNPLFHLSILEVASPQAYALVGMAATLAGVCQVPLTSVLLLFELTRDYRIVLPLLAAVGVSSWIASSQNRKMDVDKSSSSRVKGGSSPKSRESLYQSQVSNAMASSGAPEATDLCKLESSLCVYDFVEVSSLTERLTVAQAMRTRCVTVLMSVPIVEAVTIMLEEKQFCAVIIDDEDFLIGVLRIEDIQAFSLYAKEDNILVSHVCDVEGEKCQLLAVTPEITLLSAERIMDSHGLDQLPVVAQHIGRHKREHLVGLLEKEFINIACRAVAAKEFLSQSSGIETPDDMV